MFPLEVRVPPRNVPVECLGCRDYASVIWHGNAKWFSLCDYTNLYAHQYEDDINMNNKLTLLYAYYIRH